MREARPLSFFGTSTSHELSFLRCTTRRAFTPQAWPAVAGKRSCESGTRISTVQPSVVDLDRRLPDRVPGVVLEVVVVDRGVPLHPGGAHLQDDAGAPVAVRVEVERERVRLRERVAPRELAHDPRRLAVAEARADVERVVVEEQAQLGRLGGRLPLVGVPLQEAGGDAAPPASRARRGDRRGRSARRRATRGRAGRRPGTTAPPRSTSATPIAVTRETLRAVESRLTGGRSGPRHDAAVDGEGGPRHPARVVGGEEERRAGDVLRVAPGASGRSSSRRPRRPSTGPGRPPRTPR